MKKKMLRIFSIASLISFAVHSQDSTLHLGLQEAMAASVSNNNAIQLSALNTQLAIAKWHQADAIFLPQAKFSYDAFITSNPLNAFGYKLQQQSITAADFNPEVLNNPSSTSNFSTKLELQQSLLNSELRFQRKAAGRQVEMYRLLYTRTKSSVRFATEKTYLLLQVAYDENKVLKEALASAKGIYKIAEDYYNQGLIQKSELLGAALHVTNTEAQLKSSQYAIQDVSDNLSLLMGRPANQTYTIDPISIALITDSTGLSNERPDFSALQKGMESYDLMIKSSEMSRLPRVNGFASFQWNDKSMFGYSANAYIAGIQLSWNILNGNRTKNAIAQQRLEKTILATQLDQQKNEAQLQINHTRRQITEASFEIKQQKFAVEQASEALRVLHNRYRQGLAKTADVLTAQAQLSLQQTAYVRAIFNYNTAIAGFRFLTMSK